MRPLLLLLLAAATAVADDAVSRQNLETTVKTLASRAFGGRRGPGARKAEAYVAAKFRALGLKTQVREHPGDGGVPCRNVIGIRQAGPEPAPEHLIVSAHYDHLGGNGVLFFPGAADNAAGVAALFECARLVKPAPGRDLVFIAFDQEELGLVGSDAYAAKPLRPLAECAAFLTFDLLGREMADCVKDTLFCVGSERSDGLFEVVRGTPPPAPLTMGYVGSDVVGRRSDYVAFEEKQVPFLFFSTGEYGDYHRPTDTPERLDFDKLELEARHLVAVTRRIVAAPRPKWRAERARRNEEIASLRAAIGHLLGKGPALGLGEAELVAARMFEAQLRLMEKLPEITAEQRQMVVRTCRGFMGKLR